MLFLKLVIPEQYQAVFSLKIHRSDAIGFYSESIIIETNYQVKSLDLLRLFLFTLIFL